MELNHNVNHGVTADWQFYPVNNSSIVNIAKHFSYKIEKENQF